MVSVSAAPRAFALALAAMPVVAHAATDADLAEIRDQIRQLKETYEARIQALEQRLKDAEAKVASAPPAASPPPSGTTASTAPAAAPSVAAPPIPSTQSGLAAFNPAITAVLQGVYANLSQDPNRY